MTRSRTAGSRAAFLNRLPRARTYGAVVRCLVVLMVLETPLGALAASPRAAVPAAVEARRFLPAAFLGRASMVGALREGVIHADGAGGALARGLAVATLLEVGGTDAVRAADTEMQEATGPESFDAFAQEAMVPARGNIFSIQSHARIGRHPDGGREGS